MSSQTTIVEQSVKKEALLRLANRLMGQRVNIPEAKVGKYSIVHENHAAGDKLLLSSLRNSLLTGQPSCDLALRKPATIHKLVGPEGVWMTDLPCELVQMHNELARYARGRVLVGGLGLGIVARMAALKANVSQVVIVERQPEVIELVAPYLNGKTTVVQDDIYKYVKRLPQQFDCALLDTWQSTGEWCWQTEVVPLRRLIGTSIKKVYCWQEAVMHGQVWRGLFTAASTPEKYYQHKGTCHYYAFKKGVESMDIPDLAPEIEDLKEDFQRMLEAEEHNRKNWVLNLVARRFLTEVGSPWWEKTFGPHWDKYIP
jgi:hypothetical protein